MAMVPCFVRASQTLINKTSRRLPIADSCFPAEGKSVKAKLVIDVSAHPETIGVFTENLKVEKAWG